MGTVSAGATETPARSLTAVEMTERTGLLHANVLDGEVGWRQRRKVDDPDWALRPGHGEAVEDRKSV